MSDEIISDAVGMPRGESKARKALSKLGLQHVEGINRVVIKKPRNILFVVESPAVYKSPHSECYILFGQAETVDGNNSPFSANIQQMQQQAQQEQLAQAAARSSAGKAAEQEDEEDGEVDEEGVSAADIDVIVEQAGCSRARAVKALRANNNDLITSIMSI